MGGSLGTRRISTTHEAKEEATTEKVTKEEAVTEEAATEVAVTEEAATEVAVTEEATRVHHTIKGMELMLQQLEVSKLDSLSKQFLDISLIVTQRVLLGHTEE